MGEAVRVNCSLEENDTHIKKEADGTTEGLGMNSCCQWMAKRCYAMEGWRQRGKQTGGGRSVSLIPLLDCYPDTGVMHRWT